MKSLAPLSLVLLALASAFLPLRSGAQVTDAWDDGEVAGWYSEGDGGSGVRDDFGDPGGSFRVDDAASGALNYAIAPGRYLGDWSAATAADSVTFSLYVEGRGVDTLVDDVPVLELTGAGGRAVIDLPREPAFGRWLRVGFPLDSAAWTLEEGTWRGLLADVELLRVRAEYVTGTETVYLDNFRLSLTPQRRAFTATVCSDFEDGTPEGWRFRGARAAAVDTAAGNGGFGVRLGDRLGAATQATAPPKFLGDWSGLPDSAYLSLDLRIDAGAGARFFDKPYLVRLSGGGGVAEFRPTGEELRAALNAWTTYRVYLRSGDLVVTEGSLEALLADVTEVLIEPEAVDGTEVNRLDNVCLVIPGEVSSSGAPVVAAATRVFPNPSDGGFTVEATTAIEALHVYDRLGRRVLHAEPLARGAHFELAQPGTYLLQVVTAGGVGTRAIVVE